MDSLEDGLNKKFRREVPPTLQNKNAKTHVITRESLLLVPAFFPKLVYVKKCKTRR